MSALKFLSKKSWHTSTIRNNEKVWLKEQEAAREKARIDELHKQLVEERKLAEVQRLEVESGRLDPAQLLKRRRLNWMYEHAGASHGEAAEEDKERERDELLLGKKAVDVDKMAKENAQVTNGGKGGDLVDVEAKMREDPLFQIQKQKARAGGRAGGSTGARDGGKEKVEAMTRVEKHGAKELAAKQMRKALRREIREQRRLKRESRVSGKRARSDGVEEEGQSVRPGVYEGGATEKEWPSHNASISEHGAGDHARYGLLIPKGGSGVAVSTAFVARDLEGVQEGERADGHVQGRAMNVRRGRPPLPRVRRARGDRERELEEMQANAARLESDRRQRTERHVHESRREMEAMEDRARRKQNVSQDVYDDPARSFAKRAMSREDSMAGRIQQRRAWATKDSNASY